MGQTPMQCVECCCARALSGVSAARSVAYSTVQARGPPPHHAARRGVGWWPQECSLFRGWLCAALRGMKHIIVRRTTVRRTSFVLLISGAAAH